MICCVLASIAVFILGLSLLFLADGGSTDVVLTEQMSLDVLLEQISSLQARGLIGIAVLLVIGVPLLRIVITALFFSARRERLLVLLPVLTFAIIMFGFSISSG